VVVVVDFMALAVLVLAVLALLLLLTQIYLLRWEQLVLA
jgi:hypothetical protein